MVEGNVTYKGNLVESFPEHITINGNFKLERCNHFRALQSDISVNGKLKFLDCNNMIALPNNIDVSQGISIVNCANFKTLGGLKTAKTFTIENCPNLVTLPNNLEVYQGFNVSKCDGLTTLGNLRAGSKNLSNLGDDSKVNGFINIEETNQIMKTSPWIEFKHKRINSYIDSNYGTHEVLFPHSQ